MMQVTKQLLSCPAGIWLAIYQEGMKQKAGVDGIQRASFCVLSSKVGWTLMGPNQMLQEQIEAPADALGRLDWVKE